MKHIAHRILLFSIALIATASASAQRTVTGRLLEAGSGEPMGYCTVSVLRAGDSTLVTGVMSTEDGRFRVDVPPRGTYLVQASFIGFDPAFAGPIDVGAAEKIVDVGDIALSASARQLGEVEVVAERSSMRYDVDKKVVSVDKQVAASGGTAIDVLENVPSIQVGASGDVQLRGSSGFKVFINGRPSVLSGSDALRTIPAATIEEIEIITNPSAKYDAEGTAGILNIITKQDEDRGVRGVYTVRGGLWDTYGGDATVAINRERWTLTLSGDYDKRSRPATYTSTNSTRIGDTTVVTSNDGDKKRSFITYGVNAGIEFRPTDAHRLALRYGFGRWSMFTDDELDYRLVNEVTGDVETFRNINDSDYGSFYHDVQLDYDIDLPGEQSLRFHGSFAPRDFSESIENRRVNGDDFLSGTLSTEDGPGQRWRFNADYAVTVFDSLELEAGFLQELGRSSESSRFYELDALGNGHIEDVEYRVDVDYRRDVRAFYGISRLEWKGFGVQVGLRAERTVRDVDFQASDPIRIRRLDLFPSAHMSYNLNAKNRLMAGYSRRIERPRGWYFEPNPVFSDANTVRVGNPGILPEYVDVVELGYLRYFKKRGSFNIEAYYRRQSNSIDFIRSPFELDIIQQRPENVGTNHFAGVESQLSISPWSWYDADWIANVFYNRLISEVDGFEGTRRNVTYTLRWNQFFKPHDNTRIQLNLSYRGPSVNAQGVDEGYFSLDAGFRQDLLDKALTISLQGRDLANTVVRASTIDESDFAFTRRNDPRSPQLVLSLTYTLNNYRPQRSSGGGGGDF